MFNNNFVVINRKYEYDGQGNISKETETCSCAGPNSDGNLNYSATHTYTYDSLNRLLSVSNRETDNKADYTRIADYIYTYDENGRLDSIDRMGFPGNLRYDDRGRLTRISFNGSGGAFYSYDYAYDNYGNRTEKRYRNGGDILAKYTWTRGRLLEKIENGIDDVIGRYTYNADGIRYSKTAGGVTTKFYYNGITLTGEDRSDGKKLRYCYDREGICGFRYYNGSEWKAYTYVKNLQGDIILIKNSIGVPLVKYKYDPWGNVTYNVLFGDNEELAKINPFRYRGYYYDEESKLYYLITRYYDPWVGQFISPDSFEYLDPGTIGGINLYAYCDN